MENGPNSKYNYNYYLVPLHFSVVFLQFYPPGSGSPYWTRIRIQEGKWKRIHSPIKPTSLVGGVWCLLAPVLPLPVSQLGQDLVQIRPVGEPADHRERENKCYWRRTAWSGYGIALDCGQISDQGLQQPTGHNSATRFVTTILDTWPTVVKQFCDFY